MKKKWVNVTNRWTYLCFIPTMAGILKIIFYDFNWTNDLVSFIKELFLSLLLILIGIYLFIRINSYSHLFNPNHPH